MEPTAPSSGRQEDASPGPKSECRFRYTVPEWFLENIKTSGELKGIEAKIRLTHESPSGVDNSSLATEPSSEKPAPESTSDEHGHCFHVSQDRFDELLDTAASLQMPDRMGRLPGSRSSIILSCSMRFGLQFLDELVVLMAQELNSSLVSLNSQDLEDIGLDFYYQEHSSQNNHENGKKSDDDGGDHGSEYDNNSSTTDSGEPDEDDYDDNYDTSYVARKASRCYFGDCDEYHATKDDDKRSKDAFLALLNAVQRRARQSEAGMAPHGRAMQSPKDSVAKSSPVIFYFRDGLTLVTQTCHYPDPLLTLRHQPRHYPPYRAPVTRPGHVPGTTQGHRIREMIRHHRKSGKNIVTIFAVTHTDADESGIEPDPRIPWNVSRCRCRICWDGGSPVWADPTSTTITVLPLRVPMPWTHVRKTEWQGSVAATRIQSFKRRLHAQLSQYPFSPSEILEPRCDWFSLLPESVTNRFSSVNFSPEVVVAFNLILARCCRRGKVDFNDIRSILLREERSIAAETVEDDSYENIQTKEKYSENNQTGETDSENNQTEEGDPENEDYDQFERAHLSHVVEPDDMHDINFDLATFDQDAVASIKAIVHLWRLDTETEPSPSAAHNKTRITLLYGAPGTGKTCLARVIAKTMNLKMIAVDLATVESWGKVDVKQTIRAIFSLARKLSPCIIFIDDAEYLFRYELETKTWSRISQLLDCLSALKYGSGCPFVLAATNDPWELDRAFLRRAHKIPIRLPKTQSRAEILNLFLRKENLAGIDIENLATSTEGFSGAELGDLCNQAVVVWASQQDASSRKEDSDVNILLTDEHFAEALKAVRPSVSERYLADLEKFSRRFGPTTSATSQDDAWANFTPEMQKVIRWIDSKEPDKWNDPFFWEKRLLSLIVNPKSIETDWSHIAIDTRMEQEIKQLINHHLSGGTSTGSYGLLKRAHTGGALVYGPPGTGKTQLARVLAKECGMVAICATTADLQSKYWGEGPKAIQGLFNLGKLLAPSIIFIDEADAIFPSRENLHRQHETADLDQLLHEMDGLSASKDNPFVLLATNFPGRLDTAVLRRVPNKFYFGLPNFELRNKIFQILLREELLHPAVHTLDLAAMTSRFTGSDIRSLCMRAAISCGEFVQDGVDKGKRLLTMATFEEVLLRSNPTATKSAMFSIRKFAEESHSAGVEEMKNFERDEMVIRQYMVEAERSRAGGIETLRQSDSNPGDDPGEDPRDDPRDDPREVTGEYTNEELGGQQAIGR